MNQTVRRVNPIMNSQQMKINKSRQNSPHPCPYCRCGSMEKTVKINYMNINNNNVINNNINNNNKSIYYTNSSKQVNNSFIRSQFPVVNNVINKVTNTNINCVHKRQNNNFVNNSYVNNINKNAFESPKKYQHSPIRKVNSHIKQCPIVNNIQNMNTINNNHNKPKQLISLRSTSSPKRITIKYSNPQNIVHNNHMKLNDEQKNMLISFNPMMNEKGKGLFIFQNDNTTKINYVESNRCSPIKKAFNIYTDENTPPKSKYLIKKEKEKELRLSREKQSKISREKQFKISREKLQRQLRQKQQRQQIQRQLQISRQVIHKQYNQNINNDNINHYKYSKPNLIETPQPQQQFQIQRKYSYVDPSQSRKGIDFSQIPLTSSKNILIKKQQTIELYDYEQMYNLTSKNIGNNLYKYEDEKRKVVTMPVIHMKDEIKEEYQRGSYQRQYNDIKQDHHNNDNNFNDKKYNDNNRKYNDNNKYKYDYVENTYNYNIDNDNNDNSNYEYKQVQQDNKNKQVSIKLIQQSPNNNINISNKYTTNHSIPIKATSNQKILHKQSQQPIIHQNMSNINHLHGVSSFINSENEQKINFVLSNKQFDSYMNKNYVEQINMIKGQVNDRRQSEELEYSREGNSQEEVMNSQQNNQKNERFNGYDQYDQHNQHNQYNQYERYTQYKQQNKQDKQTDIRLANQLYHQLKLNYDYYDLTSSTNSNQLIQNCSISF